MSITAVKVISPVTLLNRAVIATPSDQFHRITYLDTAAYEGSDLMTKVTLQLLSPSDFSSNFSVTGRVCRVQDAGREFYAEEMAV